MAECECLPTCPFFNEYMADMPASTNLMKSVYCRGDNSRCARYMVLRALGKDNVPMTLFPNDAEEAEKFIRDSQFNTDI